MDTVDAPTAVRFENHTAAPRLLGIGDAEPRISWQVPSAPERWSQSHYELEIDRDGTQSYLVES